MQVQAWLTRAAAAQPQRVALDAPEGRLTYEQLESRARAAARRLVADGIGPRDRVAIALAPGAPFVEALHACLLIGAVAVPIDLRLGERERAAQQARADLVIEAPLDPGPPGKALPPPRHDLDAIAAVIHTSGTTAAPRPVELTYGNWLASALGSAVALGLDRGERWLCTLPLCHVGGLSIVLRSAIYATTAVIHPRFDAERVVRALAHEEVTLISGVPTTLARLLDAGLRRPPALRCALVGGGPVTPATLARATEAGVRAAQTYGLTEACSQVTTSEPGDPSTAGLPLVQTALRIAEDGEILVAGPTVAPAAIAPDGYLHSGDLGALDRRGRLTVVGRRADTIVTGGENVAPAEVEAVLAEHPAVAEVAVHGRPDDHWGEAVVATVVLRAGARADAAELRAHCAAQLAGFKVPKQIGFVERLPRTPAGKLLRRALR